MTSFDGFIAACKMRYDFDDQFQVRYQHADGEFYDTWVSGEEVLTRLRSEAAEERIENLKNLDLDAIRELADELPDIGKQRAWLGLKDRLADTMEDSIGGNAIGDRLADALRGRDSDAETYDRERLSWLAYLDMELFRAKILELAWIQLEGSFPDDDPAGAHDDWV